MNTFRSKITLAVATVWLFYGFLSNVGLYAFESRNCSLPQPIGIIQRSCYAMNYDTRLKHASWVYEKLTAENLAGDSNRETCKFTEDSAIPKIFRATLKDYVGSDYDRGHLIPAANHKASQKEMAETFLLSNMSPQCPKLNRGYWSKLERHVRDLTKSCAVVHVFTGPLFLPVEEPDGSKWVKYKVIGSTEIAVPTHFFKILFLEKAPGAVTCEGYVLPNEPIDSQIPIKDFRTTIEKIEKSSGIIFQNLIKG